MGEALVGAMVAAMRRENRDRAAACGRRTERSVAGTDSAGAAWGYVAHPALMPTVYSPSGEASGDAPGEEVAARRV